MASSTTFILLPGKALVELDAVVRETHQADVEATEHPVEVGADVSDHARLKAESVTIEGVVSNTPVSRAGARRVTTTTGLEFLSNTAGDNPVGVSGYAETAYQKLRTIKDTRQLVTVATELRTYKSMIMTSLSVPRDARSGDALQFTAVFKEIRLAEVRHQEVTVDAPKGKKKTKTGAQPTKPASADTVRRSALHNSFTDPTPGQSAIVNRLSPPRN